MKSRKNKKKSTAKFFNDLKQGLEEIVAYKKGKVALRTEKIHIPEPPTEYQPKEIKRIRESGNYSQSIFAKVLNVSVKTVQSWESGERVPSHVALRLLEIVDRGIYRP
jgi:putative transcriptional regulator